MMVCGCFLCFCVSPGSRHCSRVQNHSHNSSSVETLLKKKKKKKNQKRNHRFFFSFLFLLFFWGGGGGGGLKLVVCVKEVRIESFKY